jgi:hypothetical protein
MKVTGIGGFIFRAKDPKALANWYKKNLGIDRIKWEQQAGPTAYLTKHDYIWYFMNYDRATLEKHV